MDLIYKNSERYVDEPSDETHRDGSPDILKIQCCLHSDEKRYQHPNGCYEKYEIRREGDYAENTQQTWRCGETRRPQHLSPGSMRSARCQKSGSDQKGQPRPHK